jgi:nitroimidazol reductase NimA-like FMN-containing flavoprotein (pyridoxamine 5'-phosphate oxidase superfamily)
MAGRADYTGVEEIGREECIQLLRQTSLVGRVGFIVAGRAIVLPVNYLVESDAVVFRTGRGTKLSHLRGGTPVAFEVDGSAPFYESGWSVLVHGIAREVVDPAEVARLRHGPLRSWAKPASEHWIRISVDEISGRRIPPPGTIESSP